MSHTEVVNLVRAAPRVVDLVVGRILEAPKPPIEAHLLPDIWFNGNQEPLGKSPCSYHKECELLHRVQSVFFRPEKPLTCSFKLILVKSNESLPLLSPGLELDGGSDSIFGVLFVKDILPGSAAFEEGSLRPLDLIHYINGAPTQDLTLSESNRLLDLTFDNLFLKATRWCQDQKLILSYIYFLIQAIKSFIISFFS